MHRPGRGRGRPVVRAVGGGKLKPSPPRSPLRVAPPATGASRRGLLVGQAPLPRGRSAAHGASDGLCRCRTRPGFRPRPRCGSYRSRRSPPRPGELRLVHLPVHASWLNQIEIYFSVVQRKVLWPNDFTDLDEVEARLLAFQRRYEQTAAPFDWRYTKADLDRLLRRLDDHHQRTCAA